MRLAYHFLSLSMNHHAQRQFTALRTVIKMLTRRGYDVPASIHARTLASTEDEYVSSGTCDITFTALRRNELIMVIFFNDAHTAKLGLAPIRDLVASMSEAGCTEALIMVQDGVTAPAASMLRELEAKSGIVVTPFTVDTLQYDIWEHVAVPRHTLLTPAEREDLLKTMRCTPDQLPRMLRSDPMARYLGLRQGDVVRIERLSVTVGTDIYYRIVVDNEE